MSVCTWVCQRVEGRKSGRLHPRLLCGLSKVRWGAAVGARDKESQPNRKEDREHAWKIMYVNIQFVHLYPTMNIAESMQKHVLKYF